MALPLKLFHKINEHIMFKTIRNKRGYFFMLDALLGLFVLVIGVILITSAYTKVPLPTQTGLLSDDLLNFLANTKIKDLNNQYAGIGGLLWSQGLITDSDNSLLQQVGEFYATERFEIAGKFVENVSKEILPPQYKYEVRIDNTMVYPINPTDSHYASRGNTSLLLTSKQITFGIINKTTSQLWGPYKVEVFVWES